MENFTLRICLFSKVYKVFRYEKTKLHLFLPTLSISSVKIDILKNRVIIIVVQNQASDQRVVSHDIQLWRR